jgi:hypothetical protein
MGKIDQRRLGGAIGRGLGKAAIAGHRGEPCEMALAARLHLRQRRSDAVDHAHHVGLQRILEQLEVQPGGIDRRIDGSRKDREVDGSNLRFDARHRLGDGGCIGHVERIGTNVGMQPLKAGCASRGGGHANAACRHLQRQFPPDAGRGTGDPRRCPRQGCRHGQMPTSGCIRRAAKDLKRVGRSMATRQMQSPPASATGLCSMSSSRSATSPRPNRPM